MQKQTHQSLGLCARDGFSQQPRVLPLQACSMILTRDRFLSTLLIITPCGAILLPWTR
ncbi:hypothetical protein BDV19DRAFT_367340 [Aspergillus venezuelensis]